MRKRMGIKKSLCSMVLLLSILQSTLIYAEERVYGISDYGPVSVNGNGVGRGKDSTYQYIEDLLYNNQGNTGAGNSGSANSGGSSPAANPASASSQNTTKSGGQNTAVTQERKWNLAKLSGNGQTKSIGSEVNANYAVVFDLDQGTILGEKNSSVSMNPASMTKVMTLLVAVENLPDLEKKITITQDIVDYVKARGASNCGFVAGEQVRVKDLLYGVILPSGADAVLALEKEIAGSEAGFVALMNKKAQDLGLSSDCKFQNATGLYHSTHHMNVKDIGEIMAAAMRNSLAREVLSTENYQIPATNKHGDGIKLTNLFVQRIKGQDTGGASVTMAKTGFVRQSMFCAVSSGKGANGKNLLVVTGYSSSTWQCIKDHATLYKRFG
jgi:hypothetical protein